MASAEWSVLQHGLQLRGVLRTPSTEGDTSVVWWRTVGVVYYAGGTKWSWLLFSPTFGTGGAFPPPPTVIGGTETTFKAARNVLFTALDQLGWYELKQ